MRTSSPATSGRRVLALVLAALALGAASVGFDGATGTSTGASDVAPAGPTSAAR